MRPFTRTTLICLFLLLVAAAAYQGLIAGRNHPPFPGPVSGTPLPQSPPSPTP